MIEVFARDQTGAPLPGVLLKLYQYDMIVFIQTDEKVTDSAGHAMLYPQAGPFGFCLGGSMAFARITATYGTQSGNRELSLDFFCNATAQSFIFERNLCEGVVCPPCYHCENGLCVATAGCCNPPCVPPQICVNGTCQELVGCDLLHPCPPGYDCVAGQCVPSTGGGNVAAALFGAAIIGGVGALLFYALKRKR